MKNISLKIEDSEAAALEQYAQESGMTKSAVVREAVAQYMVRNQSSKKASVRVKLSDLVGCIEGPGDLSTNPKYMEGFGL